MESELFHSGPMMTFVGLTLGGLALFSVLTTIEYLVFFRLARDRFHPGYRSNWPENLKAARVSIESVLGNALLLTPVHLAIAAGYSDIYFDVSEHGWAWLITSVALMLVLSETAIYWIHRWLHTEAGWRLHRRHHQFRENTPWVSLAFHPLDAFAQALPHHLCVFLFPVHGYVYLLSIALVSCWTFSIHDRVSWVGWKGINYTAHHSLHHWYGDYNYGQFFTLWDRLMGTYRDPDDARGDIPAALNPRPVLRRSLPGDKPGRGRARA